MIATRCPTWLRLFQLYLLSSLYRCKFSSNQFSSRKRISSCRVYKKTSETILGFIGFFTASSNWLMSTSRFLVAWCSFWLVILSSLSRHQWFIALASTWLLFLNFFTRVQDHSGTQLKLSPSWTFVTLTSRALETMCSACVFSGPTLFSWLSKNTRWR